MGQPRANNAPLPHVTVEDVWRGALPKGTDLAAGRAGLHREVVWCTGLRARAPAFDPLRGGELVLINVETLPLVDPRLSLAGLIESLSAHGIAAAAVLGPVNQEARALADSRAIPVLSLPSGAPVAEVEQHVLRFIVDRRAELNERAQDLHRQLSELALAGRGLHAVLARLTELVALPVVLERGGSLDYVAAGSQRSLPPELATAIEGQRADLDDWLREVPLSAFDPPVSARPLPGGRTRLIAPILVHGSIGGFLSLIGGDGELGELHRLAIGRAAHACAIELVRAGAARDARDELEEELLDVLTGGRPGSQEGARERARRKGFDLQSAYLVVAGRAGVDGKAARVQGAWERVLATLGTPALVRAREETVLALVGLSGHRPPQPRAVVEQLQVAGRTAAGGALGLGHGGVRSGPSEVSSAAREAEQALSMGRRLFGPDSITAFKDLGLYRLLLGLQSLPELRSFQDEVLSTLRQKDRSGALLKTLRSYLSTNGSPTDAAQALHLHRNTVLYRLDRIEDLLGVDLRDSEVRLTLHLALKILNVLEPEAA